MQVRFRMTPFEYLRNTIRGQFIIPEMRVIMGVLFVFIFSVFMNDNAWKLTAFMLITASVAAAVAVLEASFLILCIVLLRVLLYIRNHRDMFSHDITYIFTEEKIHSKTSDYESISKWKMIKRVKTLKSDYVLLVRNVSTQAYFLPKSAFPTPESIAEFERLLARKNLL